MWGYSIVIECVQNIPDRICIRSRSACRAHGEREDVGPLERLLLGFRHERASRAALTGCTWQMNV
jgi:hypothetical protein